MAKSIELTKGLVALVDDEDYIELSKYKWFASSNRYTHYAIRHLGTLERKVIRMHRLIVKAPDGMYVDHIDGNGLNNQRSNLRLATKSQNNHHIVRHRKDTSSIFLGVTFRSRDGVWAAQITKNYKKVYVGEFKTQEEAARAYDKKAKELFGEFACLNFPESA